MNKFKSKVLVGKRTQQLENWKKLYIVQYTINACITERWWRNLILLPYDIDAEQVLLINVCGVRPLKKSS